MIKLNWEMAEQINNQSVGGRYKYMVATQCMTYNQSQYIEETLRGFAIQETTFPVVYVVVDDASTDGEHNKIRDWVMHNLEGAEKQNLWKDTPFGKVVEAQLIGKKESTFVFVLLNENYFQTGRNQEKLDLISKWLDNSKYHAFCEGDDYWIDSHKLQKQFDIMEKHPEIDMCATGAIVVQEGKEVGEMAPKQVEEVIPTEEVIAGGGGFFSTNTLFYRPSIYSSPFSCTKLCPLDYFMQIDGALRGGVYYLPDKTSAYRRLAQGSWTSTIGADDRRGYLHKKRVLSTLCVLDYKTEQKYAKVIEEALDSSIFGMFIKGLNGDIFTRQIETMTFKNRIKALFYVLKKIVLKK